MSFGNLDSLLNKLKTDTGKIEYETLIELTENYKEIDSIFLSIKYVKKAIFNAKARNNSLDYANANYIIADIYYNYGDFDSAIEYYLVSKDIYGKYSKFDKYSTVLNTLAICYGNKEYYSKSLEYLNEMIYLNKNISYNENRLATAYSNIGFVYYFLKQYDKAENYYLQSINIHKNNRDTVILIDNYINLGLLYVKQKKNDLAKRYLLKSLELIVDNDKRSFNKIGAVYEDLSLISKNTGDTKEQEKFLLMSLENYQKSNDNTDISRAYSNLASFYSVTNYDLAKMHIEKSINIAKKTINKSMLSNEYLLLSKIYENNNDIENALYFYKKYSELKDSLINSFQNDKVKSVENINLLKEKDFKFSLLMK